jgi:hypothetical protein
MLFSVFFAIFLLMCRACAQADLNITDPNALQILQ